MIRVAIVDDHPIVREGLVAALGDEADLKIVGSAGSTDELISHSETWRPDVVVLDFEMPGLSGIAAARELARKLPNARVIIFTAYYFSAKTDRLRE